MQIEIFKSKHYLEGEQTKIEKCRYYVTFELAKLY